MTELITSSSELKSVCDRAQQKNFVILDTEFVRTRTLTPQLGLIQLNDGDTVSLIDPTCIDNHQPLIDLLTNQNCIKVLHACSEDLEAFITAFNVLPSPLFDTQFAAQLCGLGATVGYANLVKTMLGIELDKGESRTDWLARPLSAKQLVYAANDVIYLYDIYEKLITQLSEEQNRIVLSEAELLSSKKAAHFPSEFAYLLIKNNWKLRGESLLTLKYLAKWRLERARARDMALNFVLKEGSMVNIAMIMPTSKTALSKLSALTPQEVRMTGGNAIQIVNQALSDAENNKNIIPDPVKRLSEFSKYKATMASLKTILDKISSETGIPTEILSSKKQLHQVLKYHWLPIDEYKVQGLTPDLMTGWRKALFQPHLQALNL